jgi:glycopeptide antibiotics resistance protein
MRGLGGVWTLMILAVTTMPWSNFKGHAHWKSIYWIPFSDFRFSLAVVVDLVGNLLLFIPFGFCFAPVTPPPNRRGVTTVALSALTLSLAVELFQSFGHNRIASMTDVCTNVAGAIIGAKAMLRWRSIRSPEFEVKKLEQEIEAR